MKLLGLFIAFISCLLNPTYSMDQKEIHISRIKDFDAQDTWGHCTGFLHEELAYYVTAAHCFHQKDMIIVDDTGLDIMYLKKENAYYAVSEYGLLDILAFELEDTEVQELKSKGITNTTNFSIAGFSIFRRSDEITKFYCDKKNAESYYSQIVEKLGGENLFCEVYENDKTNKKSATIKLSHDLIKGASGGPYLVDGKIKGVAFNYSNRRNEITVQLFSSIARFIPYEVGARNFELHRKLLEQVKIPNKILSELSGFFAMNIEKSKVDKIQGAELLEDDLLKVILNDDKYLLLDAKYMFSLSTKKLINSMLKENN